MAKATKSSKKKPMSAKAMKKTKGGLAVATPILRQPVGRLLAE